jgi:disulfide bond formation protein DsbB
MLYYKDLINININILKSKYTLLNKVIYMISTNCLNKLRERSFFWLFIIYASFAIGCLLSAYFVEYILGYKPCALCLYQRVPYFLIIVISLISVTFKRPYKIGSALLLISIFSSIVISGYHSGVERKIFNELDSCKKDYLEPTMRVEDYLNFINKKEAVSCSDIPFKILGLSMANYNFIINIFMLYFVVNIIFNKKARSISDAKTSIQKQR